jgi:diadenosine tetraphosphate (Ap4A) HIT family hydrolase
MTYLITSQPGCPFCRDNQLLKGEVIAETADGYVVEAHQSPGNYLIIPARHVQSLLELPDSWWATVKQLLVQIPTLAPDYNLSWNIGKLAGQSVAHLHMWVIPRLAEQTTAGKGLATLVNARNYE